MVGRMIGGGGFVPNQGLRGLLKEGSKHISGLDEAVLRNIDACKQLSAIVRTSLGPNGMNKMVVNHLGQIFVTSDAATIVRELEVIHPAARLIVMASQTQEREVGDGTGLVVVLAGELLEQAENLLRQGLHTSEIIQG
jgi:T-complex protein 1 subunit theta